MSPSSSTPLIGLFGGTFDPLHNGHVDTVRVAAKSAGVDQIRLLPAHIPPHKSPAVASSEQRLAMLEAFCLENPDFCVDGRELHRQGPSFSVDTLMELHAEQPNCRWAFFIGMDSLLSLHRWHRWQDLLALTHFVVCQRPGFELDEKQLPGPLQAAITHDPKQLQRPFGQILLVNTPKQDLASRNIRDKLQQRQDVAAMLPAPVFRYIIEHKLYR